MSTMAPTNTAMNSGRHGAALLHGRCVRLARTINALAGLALQNPDQGARSTLFAATADIPGGSFVEPGGLAHMRGAPNIATPSRGAQDSAVARLLWDVSARLTSVDWPSAMAAV